MNYADRIKEAEEVHEAVKVLLMGKGKDYGSDTDANSNFYNLADYGVSPFQVWMVLVWKHLKAVFNAIRRNPTNPERIAESVRESVIDIITYCVIFLTLLKDAKVMHSDGVDTKSHTI